MTVHLLKLCVGVDTVQELKVWQEERLRRLKRAGKTVVVVTHERDAVSGVDRRVTLADGRIVA